ncbi:MAG: hypothetical protein NZ772_02640 [Cyanobacteria bacterium]|nr:hypothetical protein [Cyanobacteriota bacterium]MDW8200394.1 hypothetical protein [Cyanobacteriota bacterium SKYGB_h_bin112]
MTQNFSGQPSHNSGFSGGYSQQPPSYPPSVPMSVFRELSAELQATRIMLESLNTQNQQLVQHNQRLRQEIARMVNAALQVQHMADLYQPTQITMPDPTYVDIEFGPDAYLPSLPKQPPTPKHQAPPRKAAYTVDLSKESKSRESKKEPKIAREPVIEQEEGRYRRPKAGSKPTTDLTGLWLVLVILGIVITAFAAGFWIVRPFLSD